MNINGLQKLTLLDFPGRTACTVFLAGCDMKCPFCHNSDLIDGTAPAVMSDAELLDFLKKRFGLLDGVAFTGEPLLRKELPELLKKIKELGYAVKLDTNGAHPSELQALISSGLLDYVAMDIKNSPAKYPDTAGSDKLDLDDIKRSISILINSGIDYEFRTTVVSPLHDETSFKEIGPMIKGAKRYFLQAFTDNESVPFRGFQTPTREELEKYAELTRPFVGSVEIRGI